jgi:O-acetyl-ADP-ribose deacetylase (regulator of RNase III)
MKVTYLPGDITQFAGDAVVNAANVVCLGGGGVDGAIQRAAGPELKAWIRENVPADKHGTRCHTGDAIITDGFGLKAKKIIHTVGPMFHDSPTVRNVAYAGEIAERESLKGIEPRDLLAKSIRSSLELAEANGIKTLAFPAISCGVFGCTVPVFAKVLHKVVNEKEWTLDGLWVVLYEHWEFLEFRQTWAILTE